MTDTAPPPPVEAATANPPSRTPLCFVIDEEPSMRHFVSLIMQGSGIDTEEFAEGRAVRAALTRRMPDLIFCNVSLEAGDAIETITALGRRGYGGPVQLMSNRGSAVLENIKSIGEQNKLNMLPVLKKPFETSAIQKIIQDLKLGMPPAVAARITLEEALANNWIEFWYQPKIDLRRKQLVGAESFARARHPEYGPLQPNAFMPGASEDSIAKLAEQSIINAISAENEFSKLGVKLRISVNISVDALTKLPIPQIIREHKPNLDKWPGLVLDITEEQIVGDVALASDIAKSLDQYKIKLAIDDFGRGHSSLARLKSIPFAEMKLDRNFVADCGTDKVNAPICKTVIDLAHGFGSAAVAIGIEKASDAIALVTMGCDYGQGFLLGQPMPQERFISLLRQRAGGGKAPAQAADIPERKSA
ncbi:MAG TPA: EAL domain-containing response regulator [Pseudorhodoplanes sp.]|jgi:EAL domain-containing protein (putative c-di-GMP-specific phosphodiesterase class I)/CheY-like chemotaxis protein|nr:EAL domain-containing response regulator [Pseudorhodoplanes sp.]